MQRGGEILLKKCLIITSSIDETVDYIIEKYNLHNQCFRFDVDLFSKYQMPHHAIVS